MIESDDADPRAAVRSHLDAVEEQIELQEELRERLGAILGVLDSSEEPSTKHLVEIMEVMMEVEKYYTPEQREQIKKRGEEADWDEIERHQKEWSQILEDAEAAMKAGTPATDPKVQELVRRYDELGKWFAAGFTGGDQGLQESLNRVWAEKGDDLHTAYGKGPEVNKYLDKAREAGAK